MKNIKYILKNNRTLSGIVRNVPAKAHNLVSLFFVLCSLFFTISCEDFLDAPSKSTLDEQTIFSNKTFAEQAIAGVIHSFGEQNSYRGRYLSLYGLNTDIEIRKSLSATLYASDPAQTLATYLTTPTNGQMDSDNNAWAMFYQAIERANLAIRGLRTYGDVEKRPEMAQILGEMLTLRAVVYNDLLKAWGNVPARFEPIDDKTVYVPKADRDVVLKQLIADLEEAGKYCYWPNENEVTSSTERVNKAFAKGLRARLALAAAGYSQHLATEPNTTSQLSRSSDPDLAPAKMYEIVKKECLDIINSGTCRLQGFEECFRALCGEQHLAGSEILWEIPFADGRGRVLFDLGLMHKFSNKAGVAKDKYCQMEGTSQYPIERGGSILSMPTLYYEYEQADIRRDVTSCPYSWLDGVQVPSDNARVWQFGKFRWEWLPSSRLPVTNGNDDGLNWLYMRYSDVLLMATEAINELDGPAAAAPYFRQVRQRAFPNENIEPYMSQITTSKDVFFKAIVKERALEFAGEMLRKADLIRWNMLGERIDEAKEKLQAWQNRQDYTSPFDGTVYSYSQLPAHIYYKTNADRETVKVYGLEYGDPDSAPDGYPNSKSWSFNETELWKYIAGRNPNLQPYWPIWQNFINKSDGFLNNSDYNMP